MALPRGLLRLRIAARDEEMEVLRVDAVERQLKDSALAAGASLAITYTPPAGAVLGTLLDDMRFAEYLLFGGEEDDGDATNPQVTHDCEWTLTFDGHPLWDATSNAALTDATAVRSFTGGFMHAQRRRLPLPEGIRTEKSLTFTVTNRHASAARRVLGAMSFEVALLK